MSPHRKLQKHIDSNIHSHTHNVQYIHCKTKKDHPQPIKFFTQKTQKRHRQ